MVVKAAKAGQETAVLCSGGLDSVVLVADQAQRGPVVPVYVSVGLAWEPEERGVLEDIFRLAPFGPRVAPLAWLELPMRDVYPPTHWAVLGRPPAYDTPDEDVYLIGRNVTLLSKAGVFCAQHGIGRLALGPLAGNPFPDATAEFFAAMGRALSLGLDRRIEIDAPFMGRRKADVIRLGQTLGVPLERTLSCMNPQSGLHCGECSKCRERRDAFLEGGVPDATRYAAAAPR